MRNFTIAAILMVLLSFSAPSRCVSNYLISAIVGPLTPIGSTVTSSGACDLPDGYVNGMPGFVANSYTTVSITPNGLLTLGSNLMCSNPVNNLALGTPRPVLAALWDVPAVLALPGASYSITGSAASHVFTSTNSIKITATEQELKM